MKNASRKDSRGPTARHKLNSANVLGALVIGSLVALVTESWTALLVVSGVLIALSLHDGGIRLGR